MRTRIKTCCIATAEEAQLAIRAGADALGFLGMGSAPSSPRAIDDRTVAAIVALLPPPIATFLLLDRDKLEAFIDAVRKADAELAPR